MGKIPAYVLGASGFAAGELLRLLHGHPALYAAAVVSSSSPETRIADLHPHLAAAYPDLQTCTIETSTDRTAPGETVAIFSALPHGHSAGIVSHLVSLLTDRDIFVVDMSADFRFDNKETFETIYATPHQAPELMSNYSCGVPEHSSTTDSHYVAHPGCFTTSVVLAATPLVQAGYFSHAMVASVTGSTGSGRDPKPTTHHPVRANNMYSYKPMVHRHSKEMEMLVSRVAGSPFSVSFVPHSGPFARGIHSTLFAANSNIVSTAELIETMTSFYSSSPFVHVMTKPPRLKDVVGTNNCHIGAKADDETIVLFSVIDNLVKGASGGAIQWMNRMLGVNEMAGLDSPGLGWL